MQPEQENITRKRKILLIERDDHVFTPPDLIPENDGYILIPFARQYFTQDEECDMLCQNIKVRDFSIWNHEVLAKRHITLAPYSPRHILALHFNQADDVVANIHGRGDFNMIGGQICLFNLPEQMHNAPMVPGQQLSSFHINIIPGCMRALVREFPELKGLLTKKITDQSEPLNLRACTTNMAVQPLLDIIRDCKLVEEQAEYLIRRCCVAIYSNYLYQDAMPVEAESKVDKKTMDNVLNYLQQHVQIESPLLHTAFYFNIPAKTLATSFENTFFIPLEDYAHQQKMLKAFHWLVYESSLMADIAARTGFINEHALSVAFRNYFHCEPNHVRKVQ